MISIRTTDGASSEEVEDATHYVLGGERIGIAIAERLHEESHRVAVVDESYEPDEIPGVPGDPADVRVLGEAGIAAASTAIVATGADRRNLLIAQLVRANFDVPRVIAVVHDPGRLPLFEEAGHEPFCATTALSEAFTEVV